ncbi:Kidney mitochondrial carrier protein 1 [Sciurus carolinensis]|uniref:Kidney mitochondrial carrier protein 1 n=1 Tax=Sciurus carolinensis TaxID=30640 RepID=A0AA41SY10_SCICA|nr:Kidney mitochondrial carrier protein 1 [Sciurus carolinensis]
MLHALVRIGREEGLKALYSGIAPAMLRQASYGTIKIGTYQSLKRLFVERPEDETLLINVICGILSGVISSSIANPTDVLKIRMQAQNSNIQGGMIGNFINIYQQEGTRGLWKTWKNEGFFALYKGFWPNWLRLGPWNIIVSFSVVVDLKKDRGIEYCLYKLSYY